MRLHSIALATTLVLGSAIAFAAEFTSATARLSGTDLIVSGTMRGLPANHKTRLRASADVTFTYVCVNKGDNVPNSKNKIHTVTREVSRYITPTNQGTTLKASITLRPPKTGFTCPSGLTVRLASVKYTNVRIVDTSHNTGERISGTFTKQLIAIKK